MKINKLYIIVLTFLFIVNACAKLSEGMTGSKRSKSSDEFFVHKKKPLVLPPDFTDMPMPKPTQKKQTQDNDIENLLGIKTQAQTQNDNDIENLLKTKKSTNSNTSQSASDKSLENSILKKINKN
ncbi:MAG: DUF3035 domain-containing protein [Pelagibacterales bacterium]|nr:DUF3035 domain-containing protein [Pelagibacterales bacterium]